MGTLPTDIDRPDLGSISIAISRPLGASTQTVVTSQKTVVSPVSVEVTQKIYDAGEQQQFNQSVGAGPSQGFVGPLPQQTQSRVVTTKASQTQGQYGDTLRIDNFLDYQYAEHYLQPADTWSFSVAADSLTDQDLQKIQVSSKVDVTIDGLPQTTGYLDVVEFATSADGGTVLRLEGRSWVATMVDSHVDPQTRFTPSMTLEDVAVAVAAPFGVTVLSVDSQANRNAITGAIHGIRTSKKGKPLKSFLLHQEKPYPQEGAWAFLNRLANRHGLYPRPAADGKTLILTNPDFDQAPIYQLLHKTDAQRQQNNVLRGFVRRSRQDQPSCIYASGVGGGGDYAKSTLRAGIINPAVNPLQSSLQTIKNAYPSIQPSVPTLPAEQSLLDLDQPYPDPNARPLFLFDSESWTLEQLQAFLNRELSYRLRKSLEARYTIAGHRIGGQPIAVDTIVDVDDDRSRLHTPMWVMGRRFTKHPGGGTTTEIELVRVGSIVF